MDKIKTSEDVDHQRRRLFGAAAMTFAAAQFGMIGSANAQAIKASQKELPAVKPGTHTSFGPLKQIDAGAAQCRLRRSRPRRRPSGHSSARLALRHLQLCRCRAVAGLGGLPGDRSLCARLRHDALSLRRHAPQRPAVGGRCRRHQFDGRAQDPESHHRRFRLGRAHRPTSSRRCGRSAARRWSR